MTAATTLMLIAVSVATAVAWTWAPILLVESVPRLVLGTSWATPVGQVTRVVSVPVAGRVTVTASDLCLLALAYRVRPYAFERWRLPDWAFVDLDARITARWQLRTATPFVVNVRGQLDAELQTDAASSSASSSLSKVSPTGRVCRLHILVDGLGDLDVAHLVPPAMLADTIRTDTRLANRYLTLAMSFLYVAETLVLACVALMVAAVRARARQRKSEPGESTRTREPIECAACRPVGI
jgi:hypothetical protein